MDVDGQYRGRDLDVHRARGLHVLLGVLAVGHVSRAPSAADAHRPRAHRGFREDDAAAVSGGRPPAGVGARGQRDRHDDRVPRGAGDRGRDSQGRRGHRSDVGTRGDDSQRRRGSRGAGVVPPTRVRRRRGDQRERVADARVRLRRLVHRTDRREDWPDRRRGAVLPSRAELAQRVRSLDGLHARARRGPLVRAVRPRRSQQPLHRSERVAVQLLRPARRRRSHHAPGRAGRTRAQARRAVRGVESDDRPRPGGHHRPHRPVRARQRAEPPHRLPLSVCRTAVENAGDRSPHRRHDVRAAAGRGNRQRRLRPDERVAGAGARSASIR